MWVKISRNNNYSINENGEVRNDTTGLIKKPTLNKLKWVFFDSITECADYFNSTISNISLRLTEGIGLRGENKSVADRIRRF